MHSATVSLTTVFAVTAVAHSGHREREGMGIVTATQQENRDECRLPANRRTRAKNKLYPEEQRKRRPNRMAGGPRELDGHYCFSFRQNVHFIPTSLTDNVVIPPTRSSMSATANFAASWPRLTYLDNRTAAPPAGTRSAGLKTALKLRSDY